MCAMGIDNLDAAIAPARVEFVSPNTKTNSGLSINKIFSIIKNSYWNYDVEDNAFVLMENNNGVVAQLHSSATQWRHTFKLEITLEKGSLVLGGLLTSSKSYGNETLKIISSDPDKKITS